MGVLTTEQHQRRHPEGVYLELSLPFRQGPVRDASGEVRPRACPHGGPRSDWEDERGARATMTGQDQGGSVRKGIKSFEEEVKPDQEL